MTRSSLSGPERLLFAIDAELADDYDAIGDATEMLLDAPAQPQDWSVVADTLARRLKSSPAREERGATDSFSRDYKRDRITDWIATAPGTCRPRRGAAGPLRVRGPGHWELRTTRPVPAGSRSTSRTPSDGCGVGIDATSDKLPGIAKNLAARLCELAQKRKQWDVVAAHAALKFFSEYPSASTFDELVKAARKAGVEEPVRTAALHFLETGALPYQVIVTLPTPATAKDKSTRAQPKKRGAAIQPKTKPAATSVEPTPAAPVRVRIEPRWPLPVPDYLIPFLDRPGRDNTAPRPHLDVLLEMAIAAKRPDEVLRWFDKMQSAPRGPGYYQGPYGYGYSNRVAEAVSAAYPELRNRDLHGRVERPAPPCPTIIVRVRYVLLEEAASALRVPQAGERMDRTGGLDPREISQSSAFHGSPRWPRRPLHRAIGADAAEVIRPPKLAPGDSRTMPRRRPIGKCGGLRMVHHDAGLRVPLSSNLSIAVLRRVESWWEDSRWPRRPEFVRIRGRDPCP